MKTMYTRRQALKLSALAGIGLTIPTLAAPLYSERKVHLRNIPSTGEKLPVVGVGTWQTFDAKSSEERRKPLNQVLIELHRFGGSVIDSSPMYGSSEAVVGDLTRELDFKNQLFYATKVWTSGKQAGIRQMEASMQKMGRSQMDLMQIHNLVDWKTHVKTLKEWKEKGKIRYWGITHYVDASHGTLEQIIKSERPDFAQFNYSIRSRHAERSLLDTAAKYGTAVIINQPYESGSLFRLTRGKQLPQWAKEQDINSWGQYFLKFILSQKQVTCVIPGTAKPHHMVDNMGAGLGKMPDKLLRDKMIAHLKTL